MRQLLILFSLILFSSSVFGQANLEYVKSDSSFSIRDRSTGENWQVFTQDTIDADSSVLKIEMVIFNDGESAVYQTTLEDTASAIRTDVNTLLDLKADQTALQDSASDLRTEINLKSTQSALNDTASAVRTDVNTLLTSKVNFSDTATIIQTKYDADTARTTLQTDIDTRATQSALQDTASAIRTDANTLLDLKADQSALEDSASALRTDLATKQALSDSSGAIRTDVNTLLDLKADQTALQDTASAVRTDIAADILLLQQPYDSVTLDPLIPFVYGVKTPYTYYADSLTGLMIYTSEDGNINYVNATNDIPFVNTTGDTLFPWTPLSTGQLSFAKTRGLPSVSITVCDSLDLMRTFQGIPRDTVLPSGVGIIQKQNFNLNCAAELATMNQANGNVIYVGCDSTLTNIAPSPPNYKAIVGYADFTYGIIEVTANAFTGSDTDNNIDGIANGIITQAQAVRDTVISSILYFETYNEENPAINLPFMSAGVHYDLNTLTNTGTNGYASVALTFGTANTAQKNYIYIDNSGAEPVLAKSTTAFPDEGIRLAECEVYDLTNHLAYGFKSFQRFNNALNGTVADGWINKAAKRIRLIGSVYESGLSQTLSLQTSAGLDTLRMYTDAGIVWQFNRQVASATDSLYYIWGNSPAGDSVVTDLSMINLDANGNSMHDDDEGYVLTLFYVQNSGDFTDYIYVLSPSATYDIGGPFGDTQEDVVNDVRNTAITSVPIGMSKVTIRLARIPLEYETGSGGTLINLADVVLSVDFIDDRGELLGSAGGGATGGASGSSFLDGAFNIGNSADPTKLMNFDVSAITTGTTRTITMPDHDVYLDSILQIDTISTSGRVAYFPETGKIGGVPNMEYDPGNGYITLTNPSTSNHVALLIDNESLSNATAVRIRNTATSTGDGLNVVNLATADNGISVTNSSTSAAGIFVTNTGTNYGIQSVTSGSYGASTYLLSNGINEALKVNATSTGSALVVESSGVTQVEINSDGETILSDSLFLVYAIDAEGDVQWAGVSANGAVFGDSTSQAGFALSMNIQGPIQRVLDQISGEIAWYRTDADNVIRKEYNMKGSPGKQIQKLMASDEITIRHVARNRVWIYFLLLLLIIDIGLRFRKK